MLDSKNCGHEDPLHWQEEYGDGYGVYTGCDGEDTPGEPCPCTYFEEA